MYGGQKLREYRKTNALSAVEMALRIGISQSALTRIELGQFRPAWKTMQRIAECTDGAVTANDFMDQRVA
ncbi:MAG: helix-turn-helix transcriptional regulator [Alphaproteobacteria bacterium]|nr:helix-turn-helix transcriptional regulator [Alphaproteobacteria bacterium]